MFSSGNNTCFENQTSHMHTHPNTPSFISFPHSNVSSQTHDVGEITFNKAETPGISPCYKHQPDKEFLYSTFYLF
jgi:hypothetical protein